MPDSHEQNVTYYSRMSKKTSRRSTKRNGSHSKDNTDIRIGPSANQIVHYKYFVAPTDNKPTTHYLLQSDFTCTRRLEKLLCPKALEARLSLNVNKSMSFAAGTSTASSTNAVDVIFVVLRCVEVDNMRDIRNI